MSISERQIHALNPFMGDFSPLSFSDHEPSLWKAVITQALMDAASRSAKSEAARHKREALSWLLDASSDFETVCDNAGLDPDYVRCRVREALGRDCRWRLPAGLGWRCQAKSALLLTLNQ